ncbi:MAG: hypothetical protein H6704_30375 [Myxococcales bacterium]|nr:hypothetical protein [Myxococcales bacterium]MCB9540546.1 hypothetical protein [Myxococcales bacterium]
MQPKTILKAALVLAVLFAGVQFSLVYINRLQLKSIMDSEALDGRRNKSGAETIESNIRARAESTSVHIPDNVVFTIEGTGGGDNDLWITAEYTDEVNLLVHKVPIDMVVEANAAPPIN